MITKITLKNVASYKNATYLETDKQVNLVYGLNGTGKSTLSNFLYNQSDSKFSDCSIEGLDNNYDEILVYNKKFISDYFYEEDCLAGIFTLSKENKEAEIQINNARIEIKQVELEVEVKNSTLLENIGKLSKKENNIKDNIWEIKKNYSDGDKVFDFCLENLKGKKETLLNYILSIEKPNDKPEISIEDLKKEIKAISGENDTTYSSISLIELKDIETIEENTLFDKSIIGSSNSIVSGLINQLGNSDWMSKGLKYLPNEIEDENGICPFCQEKTISNKLINDIKGYFDTSYQEDIDSLKELSKNYIKIVNSIPDLSIFENTRIFQSHKNKFTVEYERLKSNTNKNKELIEVKINNPSTLINLEYSKNILENLNNVIQLINNEIDEHNHKIDQKDATLKSIKDDFWNILRWEYDLILSTYLSDKKEIEIKNALLQNEKSKLEEKIAIQNQIITEQQKQTVNIEEAINSINNTLIDIGVIDFKIQKYSESLYDIVRDNTKDGIFRSLSEGEKMLITFLYFLELCRGIKDATQTEKKKIIVIDDPISSLSHIHIFNIGRLIKNEFLGEKKNNEWAFKYEQVFILTHSLYFFYELTDINHDRRKESQKLFRLLKNDSGSQFCTMKYEEIQNDYQSYWYIIRDQLQYPALIANCMRNIIEYFFNFVEKSNLNDFFQDASMKNTRFQAFYRYVNRESHSFGQNIFDIGEFDYNDFRDAFKTLFELTGYKKHYTKMMGC